jgi:hypothetical protein
MILSLGPLSLPKIEHSLSPELVPVCFLLYCIFSGGSMESSVASGHSVTTTIANAISL